MQITLEEIQKKFESLPENVKWAIMGANVDDNIIEIGQQQGLNVEQMGQLSLEVHMEMFGFTPTDKFEESVKNSLSLPSEKIKAIVEAVNEKILKKIRENMMGEENNPASDKEYMNEEENENKILHSSGIEILNGNQKEIMPPAEKLELNANQPILAQKLTGFVKNEVKETDHALDNLTKTASAPVGPGVNKIPHTDPYREIPE
jgi:hypothetical protein